MINRANDCGCTHTGILLIENRFANITIKSNVNCHIPKENAK